MTDVKVEYNCVTDEDLELRRDPAFYVTDVGAHELIAIVTKGDREIRVFCDGEMRVHVWDTEERRNTNDEPDHVVRYASDLLEAGITNDEELNKASERMEWGNNAWFDLYAYGDGIADGWLDSVSSDILEVRAFALDLIDDDKLWYNLRVR